MSQRTVLISGASIAGPALAFWLARAGFRTVVVERSSELRSAGQNIDVRGAGREVARRMGIEDDIRAATTGELGVAFVGADGATKAAFPAGTSDTGGATAELEILRGELARILYERTRRDTEYVFGDSITALRDDGTHVQVSFEHGPDREVDLVVVAEGMRSRTRALVFDGETQIRDLGLCTSYLTIPRTASDGSWARWYNAPGGRTLTLRPDNLGTTRATLSFLTGPRGYDDLDLAEQKALLRTTFGDAGWEALRVLAALEDAPDLYLEQTGQVRNPHWSRGRVVLLGDAAYCASPISGMGTSLALAGAYVLAGELAAVPELATAPLATAPLAAALARYEALMRPYVEQAQKLPPGAPRIANPRTRAGITVLNTLLRVAAGKPVARFGERLFSPPADAIELPDYPG